MNVFGNQRCTIVAIVCQSSFFVLWLNCAALRDKDDERCALFLPLGRVSVSGGPSCI